MRSQLDSPYSSGQTLIDDLLGEQQSLTAVERYSRAQERHELPALEKHYRKLLPATSPGPGQQYAFEVDLDKCSGCKACVSACHSLNGLEETETWRSVGLLVSAGDNVRSLTSNSPASQGLLTSAPAAFQQHVTTACHHCVDPGCLNGCPVLAYDKDPVTGIVRHLDDQCIGCSYCIMKCPYEVPKYSDRMGIVRKCDLCSDRLAVGEAPACVQACPDEAIKITLVETAPVRAVFRNGTALEKVGKLASRKNGSSHPPTFPRAHFLPDSPNPAITLPTTRYISQRGLPADVVAADAEALRLEHPHWPLVIMLVLTQAATGVFLGASALAFAGNTMLKPLAVVGIGLLLAGLGAAVLHLGQPLKAWRAFLGWRTSWLSREIILFNAFAGAATAAVAALWIPPIAKQAPFLLAGAAAAGLVGVLGSAMVYVDTQRRFWSARMVFGNFLGSTLVIGTAWTAALSGPARPWLWTALFCHTALFAWRQIELQRARANPASRHHFGARVIRELLVTVQSGRTALSLISLGLLGMALVNAAHRAPLWAGLAALGIFAAEFAGRYVFFVAAAGKRMPGGVAA